MYFKTLAITAVAAILALGGGNAKAAVIDLGFSLDESGSVGAGNFNTTRDALANALGAIPTSGPNQYRLAVTTFSSGVTNVILPTIVISLNIVALQNQLRATTYNGGSTNTAAAITKTLNLFKNSVAGLGDLTILNITTDGKPFGQPGNDQLLAEDAAAAANTMGLDSLSFEAVGSGINNPTDLENMRRIAGLGTGGNTANGVLATVATLPNPLARGFVLPVPTFAGYEAAINAKVQRVISAPPPAIPLPAGLPLIIAGLGAFGILRMRKAA